VRGPDSNSTALQAADRTNTAVSFALARSLASLYPLRPASCPSSGLASLAGLSPYRLFHYLCTFYVRKSTVWRSQ